MNEYIIWRDETFRVAYKIRAKDAYDALFMLKTGQIDQALNGNNLDMADCIETRLVDIEKANKTAEELERELEARGYAPDI